MAFSLIPGAAPAESNFRPSREWVVTHRRRLRSGSRRWYRKAGDVGSWPKRKPPNVLILAATAQRHRGANIVDRIARGRLTGHPSPAIAGMGSGGGDAVVVSAASDSSFKFAVPNFVPSLGKNWSRFVALGRYDCEVTLNRCQNKYHKV
jgi:hypothetical protein